MEVMKIFHRRMDGIKAIIERRKERTESQFTFEITSDISNIIHTKHEYFEQLINKGMQLIISANEREKKGRKNLSGRRERDNEREREIICEREEGRNERWKGGGTKMKLLKLITKF